MSIIKGIRLSLTRIKYRIKNFEFQYSKFILTNPNPEPPK